MDTIKNIQYYIEKTMLEDGDFYSAVVLYFDGEKDDYSAQTVLWELSHSNENGMFFAELDFREFKAALDTLKIPGGGHEE